MKRIIGVIVALAIGGTVYHFSQASVVNNFAKNAGISQRQAQQYIDKIPKGDLTSITGLGRNDVSEGQQILSQTKNLDCNTYIYKWQSPSLTCPEGVAQLRRLGLAHVRLGTCFEELSVTLGTKAASTIDRCISGIDVEDADLNLPISRTLLGAKAILSAREMNLYNKSLLQTALQSG